MTTEQRLERLEREIRLMRRIGAVAVAAGLALVGLAGVWYAVQDEPEDRPFRTASRHQEGTRSAGALDSLRAANQRNAQTIEQLQESLSRMERAMAEGGAAPGQASARRKEDVLAELLSIRGERQFAIAKAMEELMGFGDDVVPDIVALLKSGRDQDYGGGYHYAGNMMRGYPRLRTMLIDVLRQIGTPAAKNGLLEALRDAKDLDDYRDLLLFYRTTTDETIVRGISAMIPNLLREAKRRGDEDSRYLTSDVTRWIRKHGLRDTTDLLEALARETLVGGNEDRGAFGALVEFSPERAFDLTQQVHDQDAEHGFRRVIASLRMGQSGVGIPLAQVTRFCELVVSRLDLDERTRASFYMSLPTRLCGSIESSEARTADGRALLDFLSKRHRVETGELAKGMLRHRISRLEKAIEQDERHQK